MCGPSAQNSWRPARNGDGVVSSRCDDPPRACADIRSGAMSGVVALRAVHDRPEVRLFGKSPNDEPSSL